MSTTGATNPEDRELFQKQIDELLTPEELEQRMFECCSFCKQFHASTYPDPRFVCKCTCHNEA